MSRPFSFAMYAYFASRSELARRLARLSSAALASFTPGLLRPSHLAVFVLATSRIGADVTLPTRIFRKTVKVLTRDSRSVELPAVTSTARRSRVPVDEDPVAGLRHASRWRLFHLGLRFYDGRLK